MTAVEQRRARRVGLPFERIPALVRRSGWNGLGAFLPQFVSLAITPLILQRMGESRYAIWAFGGQLISLLLSLDGGLSNSVGRFVSLYRAREDRPASARLVLTTALLLLAIGAAAAGLLALVAPLLADHYLRMAPALRPEADALFTQIGLLLVLGLIGNVFQGVLIAYDRYITLFLISAASNAVFVGAVLRLVTRHGTVEGLLVATLLQQLVVVVAGLAASLPHLQWTRRALMTADELRAVVAFSWRMQVTGLAVIAMNDTDAFVIGALLPVRYVGFYSLGASAALALRSIPSFALPPASMHLTGTFGRGGVDRAVGEFRTLNARWQGWLTGYTAIGAVSLYAAVSLWLGRPYRTAAVVAVILVVGMGINLGTGMMSSLARALGHPGVETRYAIVSVAVNAALTVPLGLLLGVYGVEVATAVGTVVGSVYFSGALRRMVPDHDVGPLFHDLPLGLAASAAAVTAVVELGPLASGVHGAAGVLLAAVPAALALSGFVLLHERGARRRPPAEVLP